MFNQLIFTIQARETHPNFVSWEKDPWYDPKIKKDPRPIPPYRGNEYWWEACQTMRSLLDKEEIKEGVIYRTVCWINSARPKEEELPLSLIPIIRFNKFKSYNGKYFRYVYVKFVSADYINFLRLSLRK